MGQKYKTLFSEDKFIIMPNLTDGLTRGESVFSQIIIKLTCYNWNHDQMDFSLQERLLFSWYQCFELAINYYIIGTCTSQRDLYQPHRDCSIVVGIWHSSCRFVFIYKKEEIWPSPMTKAPTPTEMSKGQSDNTNNATKSSIKQQLRTDLGRSVGVTTATQLAWLTGFTGPPSHSPQQSCNQKDTHLKICK